MSYAERDRVRLGAMLINASDSVSWELRFFLLPPEYSAIIDSALWFSHKEQTQSDRIDVFVAYRPLLPTDIQMLAGYRPLGVVLIGSRIHAQLLRDLANIGVKCVHLINCAIVPDGEVVAQLRSLSVKSCSFSDDLEIESIAQVSVHFPTEFSIKVHSEISDLFLYGDKQSNIDDTQICDSTLVNNCKALHINSFWVSTAGLQKLTSLNVTTMTFADCVLPRGLHRMNFGPAIECVDFSGLKGFTFCDLVHVIVNCSSTTFVCVGRIRMNRSRLAQLINVSHISFDCTMCLLDNELGQLKGSRLKNVFF